MKKAIGQTVRGLKRGVNKKVLKVPGIEQKVRDATSNEAWGPHGSLLADIAQASRNYHEYQMIMAVIWKRINDTGKKWRHVYKALIVLEYLVGHGSERVIEEIKEHAYQISTLSNFQYVDSSGRDQGNNVRKKSESLVILVNDKERIIEVRQKAAVNRDKFHNNSVGGMSRPGSYSSSGAYGDRYENDSYGSREEDRSGSGYGREREGGSIDGDRYSRDGDRYSRDYEERSSKDGYRNDEYSGRNQISDDYQYGSRSRGSDRDHDRGYDDDGQRSSRRSSAKAEDRSLEGRLERKLSEQNAGTPPSYEEVVGESRNPTHNRRDGETSAASAPKGSFPVNDNPHQPSASSGPSLVKDSPTKATAAATTSAPGNQEADGFDEFDPRGPASAVPAAVNNAEIDLFGSVSESFTSEALAPVPSSSANTTLEGNIDHASTASFAAAPSMSNNFNQSFGDPFGDTPFKAITSTETAPSQPQTHHSLEPSQSSGQNVEAASNFGFGDSFAVVPFSSTSGAGDTQSFSTNTQFVSQDFSTPPQETDILADILPPAPLPGMTSQQNSARPDSQSSLSLSAPFGQIATQTSFVQPGQLTLQGFSVPSGQVHQQDLSAPGGQLIQPPFSSPTSQHVQQPFSAHASQSGHQAFTAPGGQLVQLPFSSPNSKHAQQPFSAHGGQPELQPFSANSGLPGLHPFPPHAGQPGQQTFSPHAGQPAQSSGHMHGGFQSPAGSATPGASGMFLPQGSTFPIPSHMAPQAPTGKSSQSANYFPRQGGFTTHGTSHLDSQFATGQASTFNSGNFIAQQGNVAPSTDQRSPFGGSNSVVSQPSKDKFETKSTVWNDTLSRGLVNLNISGAKINPLADIGIDFDAINRKEKRMEKPTTTAVTSTITMGKAMGSGSGLGRASAGGLRPSANPLMGMNMGSDPGVGTGMGMGMGSYGGINAPMGMGMGMGSYGGINAPMGMGMGMGQGVQMQPPPGPDINKPGNYNNSMMGTGPAGYPQHQQPYGGGGYR